MTKRLLATALVLATVVTGCGAPHPGISNGSVSACYRAIPAARTAVNDSHASLIGVHRVSVDKITGHLPAAAKATLAGENDTTVCALSFKGTFAPGQVALAPPADKGPYAVVLVTSKHLRVIASLVLVQLPKSLGKRTL